MTRRILLLALLICFTTGEIASGKVRKKRAVRQTPKIELQARVLPMEIFTAENTHITWKSSDESLFIVTPNEDTTKCTIEMLQTSTTPGTLTVSCNGYDVKLTVRLVG